MVDHAVQMSEFIQDDEYSGYAMIAWDENGEYQTSYAIGGDSIISAGLLPSFIADALRRRMIEEGEW